MITYSIIQKSELEGASRLDAEYYQPEYLDISKKMAGAKNTLLLKNISTILSGPAYSSEEMSDLFEIPLARIGDVTNKTESEEWIKLSAKEFEKFGNKKIRNLDILMTMTGDPPDVAKCNLITTPENKTFAFNQRVAKLTANAISPYYLFSYLSTEFARLQSERNALGIRQRNLGIKDLREIKVVVPANNKDIVAIDELIKEYISQLQTTKDIYSSAERLLLEKLGMGDYQFDADLFSIVNFSEVKTAERMDAEYFQPKYAKLEKKVKEHNAQRLGDLVTVKKGFEPGSEEYLDKGKLFIRVSSLTKQGIIDKDQKYLSDKLYQVSKKDYEPKVGEILLTKDATPGIAYVVKEPVQGIISGGIVRLKLKEQNIEPEYLALCISSLIGQSQAQRDAGGSVIMHWKPDQIKNLFVPILPQNVQKKIAGLVIQSHEARKKAKQLLEEAKQKVEKLIEKGSE